LRNITTALPPKKAQNSSWFKVHLVPHFRHYCTNRAIKNGECVADIIGRWKFASIPLRADYKTVLAYAEGYPGMNSSLWSCGAAYRLSTSINQGFKLLVLAN
jgi:hypothetical protein